MSVLVVLEHRGGKWNRISFEALAAGRELAKASGSDVNAVVIGATVDALVEEAVTCGADKVTVIERSSACRVHARRIHGSARAITACDDTQICRVSPHLSSSRLRAKAGNAVWGVHSSAM